MNENNNSIANTTFNKENGSGPRYFDDSNKNINNKSNNNNNKAIKNNNQNIFNDNILPRKNQFKLKLKISSAGISEQLENKVSTVLPKILPFTLNNNK